MKINEKIPAKVDELLAGARTAFANQDWDGFWSQFRAAANARKEKTKKLVAPRAINKH